MHVYMSTQRALNQASAHTYALAPHADFSCQPAPKLKSQGPASATGCSATRRSTRSRTYIYPML